MNEKFLVYYYEKNEVYSAFAFDSLDLGNIVDDFKEENVKEVNLLEEIPGVFYFSTEKYPFQNEIEEMNIKEVFSESYYQNFLENWVKEFEGTKEEFIKKLISEIEDYANNDEIGYSCLYNKMQENLEEEYYQEYLYLFDYQGNVANIINGKYYFDYICKSSYSEEELKEFKGKYIEWDELDDYEKKYTKYEMKQR